MKIQFAIIISFGLFTETLFGQMNQAERLFIPYLDKESQSNVVVTACSFAPPGLPCPIQYTNVLSNSNLFTLGEQRQIEEVFFKYKDVTTNSGPSGTIFSGSYETNIINPYVHHPIKVLVSRFQYTNFDAQEEWTFSVGVLVKYRTKSNDGYNVSFTRTGDGTFFRFIEVKNDLISGLLASFEDNYWQGTNWDFRRADFTDSRMSEYRQYTNGLVLGKFFMWNPRNNNLTLAAEFKEPYDLDKHRLQPKWR